MKTLLLSWLPLAVAITALSGIIYVCVHQVLRQGANDPQIALSEDLAKKLEQGEGVDLPDDNIVDPASSLDVFTITCDNSGEETGSTAVLNGKTPVLPQGVLGFVRLHRQARFTWEPKEGVRLATVVTRFAGQNSGYVLAARSLREVEKREERLGHTVLLGWLATLGGTFMATVILTVFFKGGERNER